ncbi:31251_t:CDS:1, partial [Racocetra persica]
DKDMASMQSNDHLLEEPILGDNLDPLINPTHVQPSWDQLLQHIPNLMTRQQETPCEMKEHHFINILVFT